MAYVEDGVLQRLGPEEGQDSPEAPSLRACARGLSQVQRVYHPDRLLYPLKRVGERGQGQFQRISWDEALDTVAIQMRRIKHAYGPEALLNLHGEGNLDGLLHCTITMPHRFFNHWGGQTATRGTISFEGAMFAARNTFGFPPPPPGPESLLQSKLVILWGMNPAETIAVTNTNWYMVLAKERGARFVIVDPRYTDSVASLADQWIPIRPGTDAAMLVAMAYVLVKEGLYDEVFLSRYTFGFERFKDYCLGAEDGVAKTPAWAEAICGVRAEVISNLAREYAATKPADLRGGWSPGRTIYGEQFHRACIALSAMTGNIGVPGGGPGCWVSFDSRRFLGVSNLPTGGNPTGRSIVGWKWADAVLRGAAGGYSSDIKMVFSIGGNRLGQCGDINKGIEALKKVEFVVVQDQFLTPMARYADIVLAASTHFEREDVQVPRNLGNAIIFNHRVIEPMGETRSDLDILTALAERLGFPEFNNKTEEGWLQELIKGGPVDYSTLRAGGVYRPENKPPQIPLQQFIQDPDQNPLPTPSGKIEIFSQTLARRQDPLLPPVPKYLGLGEVQVNEGGQQFPLLLITPHSKMRVHSTFANIPWLEEIEPHTAWISVADAEARGIRDGNSIKVFNEIGTLVITARVTERIMPGTIGIYQGTWHRPDPLGQDLGGSVNVLCRDTYSPGEAAPTNAVPVEVARLEE